MTIRLVEENQLICLLQINTSPRILVSLLVILVRYLNILRWSRMIYDPKLISSKTISSRFQKPSSNCWFTPESKERGYLGKNKKKIKCKILISFWNSLNLSENCENFLLAKLWYKLFLEKSRELVYQAEMAKIFTKFYLHTTLEIGIEGFSETVPGYAQEYFT